MKEGGNNNLIMCFCTVQCFHFQNLEIFSHFVVLSQPKIFLCVCSDLGRFIILLSSKVNNALNWFSYKNTVYILSCEENGTFYSIAPKMYMIYQTYIRFLFARIQVMKTNCHLNFFRYSTTPNPVPFAPSPSCWKP